jgi:hypothetical protein
MMFHLPFFIYFEIAAFIASALTWQYLKGTALRLFPLFLFFIVAAELIGNYLSQVLHQKNGWLFNISTTLEYIFYAHIFSLTLRDPAFKTMARRFMAIYPMIVLLNLLFVQGFTEFHSYTVVLGSLFMIILCCLFFYELLLNPLEGELHKVPMFWISTGLLFFHLGDLSFDLLFNLLKNDATGKDFFSSINNNLILILYSCFIIAFLCQRSLVKSLSH